MFHINASLSQTGTENARPKSNLAHYLLDCHTKSVVRYTGRKTRNVSKMFSIEYTTHTTMAYLTRNFEQTRLQKQKIYCFRACIP